MSKIRNYGIAITAFVLSTLLTAGFSSCSSDDDEKSNISTKSLTDESIRGKWVLYGASYGLGGQQLFDGDLSVYEFIDDGNIVVSSSSAYSFLANGTYKYAISEGKLYIDGREYGYSISEGILHIDTGSAYDAPIYLFKRTVNELNK